MAKKKKNTAKTSFSNVIGLEWFQNEKMNFIVGLTLFGLAIYMTVAFVSFINTGDIDLSMLESPRPGEVMNEKGEFVNACGSMGAYLSYFFMKKCFGLTAFIIPFYLGLCSLHLMRVYNIVLTKWFLGCSLVMIWASITLAKFLAPLFTDSCYNPGGDHGRYVCQWAENLVGATGLTAALAIIAIGFLTYISAETIYVIRKILNPTIFLKRVKFEVNTTPDPTVFDDPQPQTVDFDIATGNTDANDITSDNDNNGGMDNSDNGEETADTMTGMDSMKEANDGTMNGERKKTPDMEIEVAADEKKASDKTLVTVGDKQLSPYDPKLDLENYHYPTLDLLKHYETDGTPTIDMAEQTANKNRIVEVLRNFGVEISSIKATVGPTITLYEITPAQGVRISKIRNLEDDIALSLAALGIRIIAPIPGKGTIGIEVPNANPNIVSMESILNSKKFQETNMELPCAMGKTITNEVYMFDLAKIPHLLVAGATGQGKSVGLNAILTSLLYKKHPAELKIVLIDPKKVEFSIYTPLVKHFLAMVPDDNAEPIITDVTKVVRTLNSLCKEMDTRYDLLKIAGARNIKEYNKKFKERQLNPENGHKFMPYIVVVIDEFGDLIMTAGKEIELPIARIAQLARAVGIHMIIATQRPTTTIITGNIKANFPGRIAFKVSAMIDSKTILDRPGANQLIGRGDMLILNGNEPVRVQCAFVDTPEVERINQYIAQQQGYVTAFELPEPDTNDGELGGAADVDMGHLDPLFEDAARLIVMSQSGSTSLIQRKFSIGYNRAGRIMDQLEKAGLVGQASGAKPREVLIQDEMSLENLLSNLR
ncbi:MAG: DNA translocase FtsK 4TM domain-containing protein [Prevotella sp.]|nr:DNA translocase FtsK 4TM domain-containing protein [Prevotella sp.]